MFEITKYLSSYLSPRAMFTVKFIALAVFILSIFWLLSWWLKKTREKSPGVAQPQPLNRSAELEMLKLLRNSVVSRIEGCIHNWIMAKKMTTTLVPDIEVIDGFFIINVDNKWRAHEPLVSVVVFIQNSRVQIRSNKPKKEAEPVLSDIDPKIDELLHSIENELETYYSRELKGRPVTI